MSTSAPTPDRPPDWRVLLVVGLTLLVAVLYVLGGSVRGCGSDTDGLVADRAEAREQDRQEQAEARAADSMRAAEAHIAERTYLAEAVRELSAALTAEMQGARTRAAQAADRAAASVVYVPVQAPRTGPAPVSGENVTLSDTPEVRVPEARFSELSTPGDEWWRACAEYAARRNGEPVSGEPFSGRGAACR